MSTVCDKVATDVVGVVEKLAAVIVIDRPHAVVSTGRTEEVSDKVANHKVSLASLDVTHPLMIMFLVITSSALRIDVPAGRSLEEKPSSTPFLVR